jgi:DNA-binding MarR family transcriptional regulator
MYIHLLDMDSNNPHRQTNLQSLPCLCGTFRRAARALTQAYEEALRPTELRATQFTVLQALSLAGEVSQGRLGEILGIDSTTLTRTLKIMTREGWIAERPGEDRRERWIQLTPVGKERFRAAVPAWETAQTNLRLRLGEQGWEELMRVSNRVTEIITREGECHEQL